MSHFSNQLSSNASVLSKYFTNCHQRDDQTQVTYVWIDARLEVRSKTQTIKFVPQSINQIPLWSTCAVANFIGKKNNKEIFLKPIRLYNDPFNGGNNKLVLCETYDDNMLPTIANSRHLANKIMQQANQQYDPWFGFEQEYFLLDGYTPNRILGWPSNGGHPSQFNPRFYNAVGANRVYGRDVSIAVYRACLHAGIEISGDNSEACPGQWEFQIGPCKGIAAADDLWMARYILHRVAEDFHIETSLEPKIHPEWWGSGCHANFSTKLMRELDGLKIIEEACAKLERNHAKHLLHYDKNQGKDNRLRLNGSKETSSFDCFKWGVADRGASVRIPQMVAQKGFGYLEDRRPASNMDPYIVSQLLVQTICLDQ